MTEITLGQYIRSRRKEKGISLGQMSVMTCIPLVRLTDIQSGLIAPSETEICSIASVLGESIQRLKHFSFIPDEKPIPSAFFSRRLVPYTHLKLPID